MRILHAGSGRDPLPDFLQGEETRLDIDPACEPDIVASMTDIGNAGPFDIVWCKHALEHLYPYEVVRALGEFRRVLASEGRAIVIVPDLEDARPTEDVLFVSDSGLPITGLDLFYGCRAMIEEYPHMAHHNGFMAATLSAAFESAGFTHCETRRLPCFNLMGVGIK